MEFTEEQIRLVVRRVIACLGDRATPDLVRRITREVLQRLAREREIARSEGEKQSS